MISKRAGPTLILIGVLLLGFTALLVDASHGIFEPEAFAERAASSLGDPRVSEYVAGKITDGIISARPNLIALRPLIVGTMGGLVQSAPFRALAKKALATAQASAFSKGSEQVLLSVPDVGILLRSALAGVGPEVAAKIPEKLESAVGGLERNRLGHILGRLRTLWSRVQWLSRVLIIVAPLLVLAGIYLYTDRRKGLVRAGIDLAVVGFAIALLVPLGRLVAWYLVPLDPAARNAVFGLWRAYFMGLFTWASTLAGIGVVLAAAGTSLYEGVDPFARIRGVARAALEPPETRGGRALWSLGMAAAGTVILIWPTSIVAGVAILGGVLLVYAALRELFRLIIERMPEQVNEAEADSGSARRLLAIVGLAAVIIAAIVVLRRPTATAPVVSTITSCNGSPLLCDRRVDEVVFPAAHNAMSNAQAEGWMFPHHAKAIAGMLDDGIRALLIDIHYGIATSERVKTDMDREKSSLEKIQKAVGPEGYAAAMRIRDRLVVGEGSKSELYFCHGFCELGAYKVGPTLTAIRDFMVS
ncbi:MAG TPA: hypothetical protein VJN95_05155, partial [Gemmatimonadales bacterium]|nr:hypothetical protein [Gemmatimonadales bacterium]